MKSAGKTTVFFASISLLSFLLFIISSISEASAQIIDSKICQGIRSVLSIIMSIVPFSVFELFTILSPLLIIVLVKYIARGKTDYKARFYRVLSIIFSIASLYILTVGISYKAPSPFLKYGGAISSDELFFAASALREQVNSESEFISTEPAFEEICEKSSEAFSETHLKYGRAVGKLPMPKPLATSKLLSYTGALAIYSFPTGEVNINTNAPRYTIPFTVLHELWHSRGLSGEADANFAAYIVSLDTDYHYIRYSAALSVLEYMLADLKRIDFQAYLSCYNGLCERAKDDIKSWDGYYQKYHESLIFKFFDRSNKAHLEKWDKNGRNSYARVTVYVTNYLNSA